MLRDKALKVEGLEPQQHLVGRGVEGRHPPVRLRRVVEGDQPARRRHKLQHRADVCGAAPRAPRQHTGEHNPRSATPPMRARRLHSQSHAARVPSPPHKRAQIAVLCVRACTRVALEVLRARARRGPRVWVGSARCGAARRSAAAARKRRG
eukprot:2413917-Prymnesium_polylepis.1